MVRAVLPSHRAFRLHLVLTVLVGLFSASVGTRVKARPWGPGGPLFLGLALPVEG